MQIVDTHVHAGETWFEPVETLLFQMERNQVDKAVLIQYRGNYDNGYLLGCVRKYAGRFAAVVNVDPARPDAAQELARWAGEGAAGVRLSAGLRSPGADPLAIWRQAADLGLAVSCQGTMEEFAAADFQRLVAELPTLKVVVEHLGGTRLEPEVDYGLFARVVDLARYPNTTIKLPGFGELLPRPAVFHGPPFAGPPRRVRLVYDAFGPQRMMWGSDFPPSANREGYTNALRLPLERTDFFGEEDKAWIFGRTAQAVFRFAS